MRVPDSERARRSGTGTGSGCLLLTRIVRSMLSAPMHFTLFSDYVLRTLIYLGTRPDQVVPTSQISDAFGISPDHVAKAAK